jgi:hypothetical protein
MAGGPLAEEVVCLDCLDDGALTKAARVTEGVESDHYQCEKGHVFGIDWRGQPATEPQWPPPPEYASLVKG